MTELLIYAPQLEKKEFPSIPVEFSMEEFQTLCLLVLERINSKLKFDSRALYFHDYAKVCEKLSYALRERRDEIAARSLQTITLTLPKVGSIEVQRIQEMPLPT
jgi:hypothetical protein